MMKTVVFLARSAESSEEYKSIRDDDVVKGKKKQKIYSRSSSRKKVAITNFNQRSRRKE
jgi:hypothetical protein